MTNKNNSFKINTALLLLGTVLNKGVQFLVIPLFSRWLSAEEYGQFDLYYTYVLLMIPIISISVHEAVFRYGVDEEDIYKKKSIVSGGFILNVINLVVVSAVTFPFFNKWGMTTYLCFMTYLCAELFATYLRGFLRSIKRLDIYSFAMVVSTMVMAIIVTILVYGYNLGLQGMLAGYALGTLVGDLIICLWSKWGSMISFNRFSVGEIKRLVTYSVPLVPNDISWWIMNASDRQIINVYYGNAANGIYAIAHKIPALCSVVFNMFTISWQQEVVERIDEPEHNHYFNAVFNKMLVLLLSFCACLLTGSWILYYYVFDMKYMEASRYSPILIVSAIIMALSQFLGGIQIALKKPRENGVTTVSGAVCNIAVHFILIQIMGLYAAAISTLVANILIFVLRLFLLRRFYRISVNKNSYFALVIFMYSFVMAYQVEWWWLNVINVLIAGIAFLWINKGFIKSLVKRNG